MIKQNIIIFFFLLLLPQYLYCSNRLNDIKVYNYKEIIVVHGIEGGFTKTVSIAGFCKNKSDFILAGFDLKNESFTDFKLYYKKRSKYKEFSNPKLAETSNPAHFYTSAALKSVELESEQYFLCTFKINCKNLILFDRMNLSSIYETDTAKYEISIPKNLIYRYDSLNIDSLKYLHIDFSARNDSQIINIKAKPYSYSEHLRQNNTSFKLPLIRQIIVPLDKKGKEELIFNNWYLSSIDSVSHLNEVSKRSIDSIQSCNSLNVGTIQLYYDYIKSRFKYLDLEVGLGAIIPRDVNLVLKNKQGDCKDFANLLRTILQYKGFDARLALTATNNHYCDFNFPSLCSGNHEICVVKNDTGLVLLDATDFNHRIGQPVKSLQDRTLFIISKDDPSYYRVPVLNSGANEYNIKFDLKIKANYLEGCFKIVTHGFVDSDVKRYYSRISNVDFHQLIQKELEDIFHTKELDSIKYSVAADSMTVKGNIKYFNKQYRSNNVMYFFIDYIPSIFSNYYHKNKIENEAYLGSTLLKKFSMTISTDAPINNLEFTPLTEVNRDYKLNFNAFKLTANSININYTFEYNKIWIKSNELDVINNMIDKFNKKSHETVIVHF